MGQLNSDRNSLSVAEIDNALQRGDLARGPDSGVFRGNLRHDHLSSFSEVSEWDSNGSFGVCTDLTRPSGTTAVASTQIPPIPLEAMDPMWTRCQSVACPLSEESIESNSKVVGMSETFQRGACAYTCTWETVVVEETPATRQKRKNVSGRNVRDHPVQKNSQQSSYC